MSEQAVSDPYQFARGRNSLEGDLTLASLLRVSESLANSDGVLHYRLSGFLDEQGQPGLRCEVQASLQLVCQRCLEPMTFPLRLDNRLLFEPQTATNEVDDDCESPDRIKVYPDMPVALIVEEEILLALPMAARHAEACSAPQQTTPSSHAFAVLAQLKAETER